VGPGQLPERHPGVRRAIQQVLEELDREEWKEEPEDPEPAYYPPPANLPTIIRTWYRQLTLEHHPDRGGSKEAMQAINEAHDRLKRLVGVP
jgi:hypothetical protein